MHTKSDDVPPHDTVVITHESNTVIIMRSLMSDYVVDHVTDNHPIQLHVSPPYIKLILSISIIHYICNALL